MAMFDSINMSSSALTAERMRMDVIAKNITNAQTTRTKNGLPYRRQVAIFKEVTPKNTFASILSNKRNNTSNGVEVVGVREDTSPFNLRYDPGHPDADKDGYVKMSNVDLIREMVDMISAQRSYEANVTSISTTKSMLQKALEIGR